MEKLENKERTILNIYDVICSIFGSDFFFLPDFWDADAVAIGLLNRNKLIYISTWQYKNCPDDDMKYYAEFEIIDGITSETISIEKKLDGISESVLIKEMIAFVTDQPGDR